MRLTDVWMVSVDQDHAFHDQHIFQLGIRSGSLTVLSRVLSARIVCFVGRDEGGDHSIIDSVSSNDSKEVFLGF